MQIKILYNDGTLFSVDWAVNMQQRTTYLLGIYLICFKLLIYLIYLYNLYNSSIYSVR